MAVSYLRRGMTEPATFSLFARRLPPDRGFLVAAGIESCLDLLGSFAFIPAELEYLQNEIGLTEADVEALADLRFEGDVHAVPEGRIVLADEPILEVTAPLPQAQLVETLVLNQITYATAVASKAARCRLAAPDAVLVDFAARRTHGLEAASAVARSSAIVGFDGTSYVDAARRLGLPAVGTMAHAYVEAFESETAAFDAFAQDFPEQTVFLVDTYDTPQGVARAIAVAREHGLAAARVAVRLDSGDLLALSRTARRMLDDAGMPQARVMASGSLDEYVIARLVAAGAPIDVYGIGTRMGVSWDAPSLDSAYKLVSYAGRPVLKLSTRKVTLPDPKQVYRRPGQADLLALRLEQPVPGEQLLRPVMVHGRRTGPRATVATAREWFAHDVTWLPAAATRLERPVPPEAEHSLALQELTARLTAEHEQSRHAALLGTPGERTPS